MKDPLVSVIITCYNYGKYISKSIDSVLSQTYPNIQLIVIDDGSTDNSVEVINRYRNDANIIYNKINKGTVITRNRALKEVKGDFFIFIDADDTIPDNFISEMVNVAMKNKLDVVYCDLTLSGLYNNIMNIDGQSIDSLVKFSPVPICQLVKSKWIKNHKFVEKLNNLLNEDNDFFFGLWADGAKFGKAERTTYYYYVHEGGRGVVKNAEYYKPRFYILNKYASKYPEIIDRMAEIFAESGDILEKAKQKDIIIEQKNIEISNILNSRSYKIGRLISRPFSLIVKVIRKIQGA